MRKKAYESDSRIGYQIAVFATKFLLPVAMSSSSVHRLNWWLHG